MCLCEYFCKEEDVCGMQKCLEEKKGEGENKGAVMLVCRGACLVESRLSEKWPSTKDEKKEWRGPSDIQVVVVVVVQSRRW